MEPFTVHTGVAVPLLVANIDTDVIIRIDRIAKYARDGLGPFALEALRRLPDGRENADCILNAPAYRNASILLVGDNFGCGSSRENAVWALMAMGLRVVIAPSFGDIFFGNCFQNGMLPIQLHRAAIEPLAKQLIADPDRATLTVDLQALRIRTQTGAEMPFAVEPLQRRMLLEGLDQIGLTLTNEAEIAQFQSQDRRTRPWLYAAP
ncbi:MAG: 3-isopropylmalate dehydratase small subunit [Betaproteobacteria bacterium]|nr:3-isopropylmalate dehydratase small subunit [Betaproteobacteria bacterium]